MKETYSHNGENSMQSTREKSEDFNPRKYDVPMKKSLRKNESDEDKKLGDEQVLYNNPTLSPPKSCLFWLDSP